MDASQLAALAGGALSLAFSYIPGLKTWFDGLTTGYKQLVMGVALIVVALVVFGISCAGLGASFGWSVACTAAGAVGFLQVLITALVANQAVFLITKK